jgi:hypothetical protein
MQIMQNSADPIAEPVSKPLMPHISAFNAAQTATGCSRRGGERGDGGSP